MECEPLPMVRPPPHPLIQNQMTPPPSPLSFTIVLAARSSVDNNIVVSKGDNETSCPVARKDIRYVRAQFRLSLRPSSHIISHMAQLVLILLSLNETDSETSCHEMTFFCYPTYVKRFAIKFTHNHPSVQGASIDFLLHCAFSLAQTLSLSSYSA